MGFTRKSRSVGPKPSSTSLTAPAWEILGLLLLLMGYLLGYLAGPTGRDAMNLIGPLCLMGLLGISAMRMALKDTNLIWPALFWFRISVVVYYGLGSLVAVAANDATREYLHAFYAFDASDVAKLNVLVALGCLAALIGANISLRTIALTKLTFLPAEESQTSSPASLLRFGILFLAVGGIVKYFVVLPNAFGLNNFVIPNSLETVGKFSYAATYLLTLWSWRYCRKAFPVVCMFVLGNMLVGLLALTKFEALIQLTLFLIALMQPRISVFKVVCAAAIWVICYKSIVPIVAYGRLDLGENAAAGFGERFGIIGSVLASEEDASGKKSSLTRLSYVNQAAFAIRQYDGGRRASTLSNAHAVFIPRFLWPDKPNITQIANDFNESISGNASSANSPGIFADSYWNGGWLAVALAMCVFGIVLGVLSQFSLDVIRAGKWLYTPLLVFGMHIGYRTDGYLVSDCLGGTVILLAFYILLRITHQLMILARGRMPGRMPKLAWQETQQMRPNPTRTKGVLSNQHGG